MFSFRKKAKAPAPAPAAVTVTDATVPVPIESAVLSNTAELKRSNPPSPSLPPVPITDDEDSLPPIPIVDADMTMLADLAFAGAGGNQKLKVKKAKSKFWSMFKRKKKEKQPKPTKGSVPASTTASASSSEAAEDKKAKKSWLKTAFSMKPSSKSSKNDFKTLQKGSDDKGEEEEKEPSVSVTVSKFFRENEEDGVSRVGGDDEILIYPIFGIALQKIYDIKISMGAVSSPANVPTKLPNSSYGTLGRTGSGLRPHNPNLMISTTTLPSSYNSRMDRSPLSPRNYPTLSGRSVSITPLSVARPITPNSPIGTTSSSRSPTYPQHHQHSLSAHNLTPQSPPAPNSPTVSASTTSTDEKTDSTSEDDSEHFDNDEHSLLLPKQVTEVCEFIRMFFAPTEGLFRISGDKEEILRLKSRVDNGEELNLFELSMAEMKAVNIHDFTGLFKLYFRMLPDPLIPFSFYANFLRCFDEDKAKMTKNCVEMMKSLPAPNEGIFQYLLAFLAEIAENEKSSRMNAVNLSIVFAPNLVRLKEENMASIISDTPKLNAIVSCCVEWKLARRRKKKEMEEREEKEAMERLDKERQRRLQLQRAKEAKLKEDKEEEENKAKARAIEGEAKVESNPSLTMILMPPSPNVGRSLSSPLGPVSKDKLDDDSEMQHQRDEFYRDLNDHSENGTEEDHTHEHSTGSACSDDDLDDIDNAFLSSFQSLTIQQLSRQKEAALEQKENNEEASKADLPTSSSFTTRSSMDTIILNDSYY